MSEVTNDKSKLGQQNIDSTVNNHFNFGNLIIIIGGLVMVAIVIFFIFDKLKSETEIVEFNHLEPIFQNSDSYNILLLPFGSSQNCDEESIICEREVESRFNLIKEQDNIQDFEVQVYEEVNTKTRSLSYDKARELGYFLGADLIVWGDYQNKCEWDSTKVRVKWASITLESGFIKSEKNPDYQSLDDISKIEEGIITGNVEEIVYWSLGVREFFKENYPKALSYFNKLTLKATQEYAEVYSLIGNCYFLPKYPVGDKDSTIKAIYFLSKAIELDSSFASNLISVGQCFDQDLKDTSSAIKAYTALINSTNYAIRADVAYFNRGATYNDLKDYEKAITDYTKAIELNPKYAKAYNNRGINYSNLKDYEKAISDYTKAIEFNPKDINAYLNRGIDYCDLKDYEKAIADFKKVLQLNPKLANNQGINNELIKQLEKEYQVKLNEKEKNRKKRWLLFFFSMIVAYFTYSYVRAKQKNKKPSSK